jgi:hypothetical protein
LNPPGAGVTAAEYRLTGYAWGENIGWINLSCRNGDTCGTAEFGVANDGAGNLSGFAWGENIGWINFNPTVPGSEIRYGVTIDDNGNFSGWAWGENIGWIRFSSAAPLRSRSRPARLARRPTHSLSLANAARRRDLRLRQDRCRRLCDLRQLLETLLPQRLDAQIIVNWIL